MSEMKAMKTVEVSLTEAEYEKLSGLATARKMPPADLLRDMTRIYLIQEPARIERGKQLYNDFLNAPEDTSQPGPSSMTMEEIIEEIALYRREKSELAKSA